MFWLLTMSRKHTILDNRIGNRKRLCRGSGRLSRSRFYVGQYLPLRRSSRMPGGAVTEESLYIANRFFRSNGGMGFLRFVLQRNQRFLHRFFPTFCSRQCSVFVACLSPVCFLILLILFHHSAEYFAVSVMLLAEGLHLYEKILLSLKTELQGAAATDALANDLFSSIVPQKERALHIPLIPSGRHFLFAPVKWICQSSIASPKGFPPKELAFSLGAVELQPILKPHGHKPGFPIAPVEHGGHSVQHPITVPDGLFHRLANISAFQPACIRCGYQADREHQESPRKRGSRRADTHSLQPTEVQPTPAHRLHPCAVTISPYHSPFRSCTASLNLRSAIPFRRSMLPKSIATQHISRILL